jgi:glycosyltransferase involved in cell wall biosynthesis
MPGVHKPKALIIAIHHWDSPFQVGTHYIARYLLRKGFEVAYISAPVTFLHRLKPATNDLTKRKQNSATQGQISEEGVWHYVPYALIAPDNRPLLSSSLVLNHWQKLTIPNVFSVVKENGFADVDVLFIDSIYQPFWLSAIKYKACAYRLADNSSGFAGYSEATSKVESHIIKSADQVFCASSGLLDYAQKRGAKSVTHLANGIDLKKFPEDALTKDFALPHLVGPVAIYVGAFERWFDHRLILELATERPDVNILLVGPVGKWTEQYQKYANVHVLGSVSSNLIPAYLALADVGLIPFDVKNCPTLVNDVNPLKLYEYMAAGLTVVASHWNELERLNSPAILVKNAEEFVSAVGDVLSGSGSGSGSGLPEKEFASQFDWQQTLAPLGNWLDQVTAGAA